MGRVVPKDEIFDAVWPDVVVGEDSLTQAIREIRKGLGDAAQDQVRTVSRRGYMLIGEPAVSVPKSPQPIVAVLRFRNEASERSPDDDNIVDGFAEDIINGLARFGSVTVLARASTFAFASYAEPRWSTIAAKIGADFVVEGSLRRSGDQAQITVGLADAQRSVQVWSERYEAKDVELFAVQREISEQIVSRLVSRLDEASLRRTAVTPAANLETYELLIRGVKSLSSFGASPPGEARALFNLALEKDPNCALAYGYLALELMIFGGLGRTPPEVLEQARRLVEHCIGLSPEQSIGHRIMSLVRLYCREHAGAETDLRLSLELNPCDPHAVEQMGFLMIMRGRALEAMTWIDRAVRLNPLHPQWYDFDRALARYVMGEYDEAVEVLRSSHDFMAWTPMLLAASYAKLGEKELASAAVNRIATAYPSFSPLVEARGAIAFEQSSDIEHLAEGVALALEYAAGRG